MADIASACEGIQALQVGAPYYIPDNEECWLPAVVEQINYATKAIAVSIDDGDQTVKREIIWSKGMNFPLQNLGGQENGIEDMIELNHLHEAAILDNLRKRFFARLPYTYTGEICLALNPYQWIPKLYASDLHDQYLLRNRKHLPPHIYAISVAAYKDMVSSSRNQSILVSGESGAGKTETTKIIMNHLAAIASDKDQSNSAHAETIANIIEVNPLLESFGNAKTKRNDNSSRFGKFTQLQFDGDGILAGARCETYLLEKTRVVTQEEGERNYHIFYQLLEGIPDEEKHLFQLSTTSKYKYLRTDPNLSSKGGKKMLGIRKALSLIGLSDEGQTELFTVLAGIIHIGEIQVLAQDESGEEACIEMSSLSSPSHLLGLDPISIQKALCSRTMRAGGEVYSVPLNPDNAGTCRDALAKAIYSNIFNWIVEQINNTLSADSVMKSSIGVLDIFGFESFVHNSYEQLCINYANEKLQQKFTQDVFKAVHVEYQQENICWDHIAYQDNQDILQLIEGKMGIISILNEEVVRPRGNEEGFVNKLACSHKKQSSKLVQFPRTSRTKFIINHYAAPVTYEATGFLEKHKDALLPDLSELMLTSSCSLLKSLFHISCDNSPKGGPKKRGGLSCITVGTQFKESLNKLMDSIDKTNVNYVRCIKPNSEKSPDKLDAKMVVAQLRCAGVIEAISIARAGYPNRMPHQDFVDIFEVFSRELMNMSIEDRCESIATRFELRCPEQFQMGKTKIYMQLGVLEHLQDQKAKYLFRHTQFIQSRWRCFQTRKTYLRQLHAVNLLQSRAKCHLYMKKYRRIRSLAINIQRLWRGHVVRIIFKRMIQVKRAILIQSVIRRFLAVRQFNVLMSAELERRRNEHEKLCTHSALEIQSQIRGFLTRKRFAVNLISARRRAKEKEFAMKQQQAAIVIQAMTRTYIARVQLYHRRVECQELICHAVTIIQAYWRGATSRKQFRAMKIANETRTIQIQATVVLQAYTRGFLARREVARMKYSIQLQAVMIIQALFRGVQVRIAKRAAEEAQKRRELEDLKKAFGENYRLRQQLQELLLTNLELEGIVGDLICENDILVAKNRVNELELKSKIHEQRKKLISAKSEQNKLREYIIQYDQGCVSNVEDSRVMLTGFEEFKIQVANGVAASEPENEIGCDRESILSESASSCRKSVHSMHNKTSHVLPSKASIRDMRKPIKTDATKLLSTGVQTFGKARRWMQRRKE